MCSRRSKPSSNWSPAAASPSAPRPVPTPTTPRPPPRPSTASTAPPSTPSTGTSATTASSKSAPKTSISTSWMSFLPAQITFTLSLPSGGTRVQPHRPAPFRQQWERHRQCRWNRRQLSDAQHERPACGRDVLPGHQQCRQRKPTTIAGTGAVGGSSRRAITSL